MRDEIELLRRIFDTLAYAKRLRDAGFTEEQSEVQAEALWEVVDHNLATKQGLKELENPSHQEIVLVRDEIELLRRDMRAMESRITLRLGGMIVAGVAILAVLMKVL